MEAPGLRPGRLPRWPLRPGLPRQDLESAGGRSGREKDDGGRGRAYIAFSCPPRMVCLGVVVVFVSGDAKVKVTLGG